MLVAISDTISIASRRGAGGRVHFARRPVAAACFLARGLVANDVDTRSSANAARDMGDTAGERELKAVDSEFVGYEARTTRAFLESSLDNA
jgi:hypothetical protein